MKKMLFILSVVFFCFLAFGSCSFCQDTGKIACSYCKSAGILPCKACKGNALIQCSSCQGTGIKETGCPSCSSSASRKGSGEIEKDYKAQNLHGGIFRAKTKETCDQCGGKGKIEESCPNCSGRGKKPCGVCRGSGSEICTACKGRGFRPCTACLEAKSRADNK